MSTSLHPMLNIAIKAARAAGAIINRGSQELDLLTVSAKGPNDFVSEVDRAAEAAVIETILTAYPGHGILAEESGREHGAKHSDFLWIIDPLDGTTNFLHGLPMYCVSIALAFRGKVEQAVVYDPTRNDLFYASRGRGAYLNDRRLRVSRRTRLGEALVGTGFPFRRGDNFQRYLQMFELVMQSTAGVRRPGAAALDLCYVAAGWYDGFFETGLSPWDMAAGALMVTEAGGLIGNLTGEADFLFQREVLAANPKIYGQLVTLLAPFSRAIAADAPADGSAAAPVAQGDVVVSALAKAARALPAGGETAVSAEAEGADAASAGPEAPAARERKPVRIRRADVQPVAEPTEGAVPGAGDATEAPGEAGASMPAAPDAPANPVEPQAFQDRPRPTVQRKTSATGPGRPDDRARGPRPEGDRPRRPRTDGPPPRGPRRDDERSARGPRPADDGGRPPRPPAAGPRGPTRGPGPGGRPPAKKTWGGGTGGGGGRSGGGGGHGGGHTGGGFKR